LRQISIKYIAIRNHIYNAEYSVFLFKWTVTQVTRKIFNDFKPNFIVVYRHYKDLNCELNSFFFNFRLHPFLTYSMFITFTFNPNNHVFIGIFLLASRQLSGVAPCFNLSFAFWMYMRVLIMKYITFSVSTILSWPKRWKT